MSRSDQQSTGRIDRHDVALRLYIGLIVLICAEVFSGASVHVGLWRPWTWVVTYWLYFAHFFLFTTLAVRTGRTSLWSLYLWGVLFGLYESWITKVIWYGYSGNGEFVAGSIGPYGYSEISMVFFFHPFASFIIPLAVACLLLPPLRALFPDLAWFTSWTRGALAVQVWMVVSLASILGMNSGGPLNLALNWTVVLVLLFVVSRLARPALSSTDGRRIVVFGRRGCVLLSVYLVLLYVLGYLFLRPEGLPSAEVQLLTLVFYAAAVLGLYLHRRRKPLAVGAVQAEKREWNRAMLIFILIIAGSFVLSFLLGLPALFAPIMLSFVAWPLIGFLLMGIALVVGTSEFWARAVAPNLGQRR